MVTARHEAMHRIFQEDPGVFARAFKALDISFPAPVDTHILSPDATEVSPIERRVDTVIRFETASGDAYLLAVEAQCRKDLDKPGAWAYYASYLHEKHGLPVVVLVVCQDNATAKWAEGPLHLGLRQWPTLTVRPLVLGPGSVPAITDVVTASRDIPLATLSAVTHALDPEVNGILKALSSALKTTDEETARIFAELTELGLGNAPAAKAWSELMTVDLSFYRSRTSQMLRNEGIAGDVLLILADRGLAVSGEVRARVEGCEDAERLRMWLLRAVKVERAEDIFGADGV